MKRYEKHIFICENKRAADDPKGCCFEKGGTQVKEALKKRLKEMGLASTIRANAAGCLDACSHGVSIVVYPEQIWYGGVTIHDIDEIIKSHLIDGNPVERLKIKDPKYHKDVQ